MKYLDFTVTEPEFRDTIYSVKDFGAKGDGFTNNTEAINAAISRASKAGGGVVTVPRGIFFTGPIRLQNDVNLHLQAGAVLLFSANVDDYPLDMVNYEGSMAYRCTSPISAKGCTNIAITGKGVINGSGDPWRPVKKFKVPDRRWKKLISSGGSINVLNGSEETWWPTDRARIGHDLLSTYGPNLKDYDICYDCRDFLRPCLIYLENCHNILIKNVTLKNSPAWSIHPFMCDNITVKDIIVSNSDTAQNSDGIDIDCCHNVKILDSSFDVGDDGICMKSGKNEEGRARGISTHNVYVCNCTVFHGHGGFVLGSEMSGGLRNIEIEDCTFITTDVGIKFKSCVGRGGVIEDIYIHGINMMHIPKEAIVFTTGYDMDSHEGQQVSEEEIPEFKNITIENITCTHSESPILITGLKNRPIHDVTLRNIRIAAKKLDKRYKYAENIKEINVVVTELLDENY
ncbi:MAG: glycoside hydrolase family 28 protein [Clostridiales bacterium]|nr:glycoside hydrolase family 28 protein [Clostridiales bacterium]